MSPAATSSQRHTRRWHADVLARLRWSLQRGWQALGRVGLLALASAIVLGVHGALVLWPEQGELQRQRIALIGELQACRPPVVESAVALQQAQAQLRMAVGERKLAVMEQLSGAGLLLIDVAYHGEDAARGRLRRTSMEVSAVGSYRDLTAALTQLAAQPLLRMETLTLDRQRPENRLITVKMKLSLLGAPR